MTTTAATGIRCIADIVRVHARHRGQRPALTAGQQTVTFSDFYQRAQEVAGALEAGGVRSQDRIAVIDHNGIETLEVVFGAALLNAVTVNVNWRLAPPEILQILKDAGSNLVFVGPELYPVVAAVESELGDQARIIAFGQHDRWESYDGWRTRQPAGDPGTAAGPDDVAFQLYTSGTTGLPKGVMLTTTNLLTLLSHLGEELGLDADSVNLAVMPMFHIAGLGWAAVGLYGGCRTVVVRNVIPAEVLRTIEAEGVTHAFLVPAVIQMLLQSPEVETTDFSALRSLSYGASPISAAVLERAIATMGCDFVQMYGLTETTGTIVRLAPGDHDPIHRPALLRSCGQPYPWVEMRIVDGAGRDVAEGTVGELWTRSAQNMAGYWNNPAATADAVTPDGWLRTGDAGYRDGGGYLYLHDRVKDMIVSGGENVYPAEVENALMRHPAVADVAVIGVPDDRWGEAVKAIVVATPGSPPPSPEDLIAFSRQQLAGYKCPKTVDFATTLPRNPSGKLLKRELRAPYWGGAERQVG